MKRLGRSTAGLRSAGCRLSVRKDFWWPGRVAICVATQLPVGVTWRVAGQASRAVTDALEHLAQCPPTRWTQAVEMRPTEVVARRIGVVDERPDVHGAGCVVVGHPGHGIGAAPWFRATTPLIVCAQTTSSGSVRRSIWEGSSTRF